MGCAIRLIYFTTKNPLARRGREKGMKKALYKPLN